MNVLILHVIHFEDTHEVLCLSMRTFIICTVYQIW